MPINFTTIFQDSWNFMRNQQGFTRFFIAVFGFVFLFSSLFSHGLQNTNIQATQLELADLQISPYTFILYFSNLLIMSWGIVSIHQISQRQSLNLTQALKQSLKRLLGMFAISLFIALLMTLGFLQLFLAIEQHTTPSPLSLVVSCVGLFVFVRLYLAPTHYVLQSESIINSIKFIWQAAYKKGLNLLVFFLFINVFLPFITYNILASINFLPEMIWLFIGAMFNSILNVFALIFTYRFYILFIQKA